MPKRPSKTRPPREEVFDACTMAHSDWVPGFRVGTLLDHAGGTDIMVQLFIADHGRVRRYPMTTECARGLAQQFLEQARRVEAADAASVKVGRS